MCLDDFLWTWSFFLACKIANKIYKIGERFIRKDCSEGCICNETEGFGILSCEPVCNKTSPPACLTWQQIEVFDQQVKGTNCSCSQRRCVNRKNVLFILKYLWGIMLYPSAKAYLIWMSSAWYLITWQEGNKESKLIYLFVWIYFKASHKDRF